MKWNIVILYICHILGSERLSPFSNRACGMNPSVDEKPKGDVQKVEDKKPFSVRSKDSDDDEDYSYEEVILSQFY